MYTDIKGIQDLVRRYRMEGGTLPLSPDDFADWAIEGRHWAPTREAIRRVCAEQFSRAMREEYTTDSKGRRVRTKHAVIVKRRGTQTALWDDWKTAPRAHMVRAFQQRRNGIVGDCRQLKNDVDSYNEDHADLPAIQLILDFTLDMIELEAKVKAA